MKVCYCNKCGKKMDQYDMNQNFNICIQMGYGSAYDGEVANINLCCECADELIRSLTISPFEDDNVKKED